nr:Yip1 family protein [uncultured Bacteroides sp.]
MNTIERAKNIILSPKTEWKVIETEEITSSKLLTSYLLLLALIPAICGFIGYGLVGYNVLGAHFGSIDLGIRHAATSYVSMIAGVYLTAFIINKLAPKFSSLENFDKAFQLVVYSYTPMFVAGVFYLFPSMSTIAGIFGLYGLYILYIGLAPMMKTPEEKVTSYFLTSIIALVVISLLLSIALGAFYF